MSPEEDPACPLLRAQLEDLMDQKEILDAQIAAVQQALQTHGCKQSGGGGLG